MATDQFGSTATLPSTGSMRSVAWNAIVSTLKPLASLRLTVILFAFSILIILFGTLAQVEKDMWEVIDDYFRTWLAWIEIRILFPPTFFSGNIFDGLRASPAGFPFPGGALIGSALCINLVAAHLVRFKIQAKGRQLAGGLFAMAVACGLTAGVIAAGHGTGAVQDIPLLSWALIWNLMKLGLFALFAITIAYAVRWQGTAYARWLLVVAAALLGSLLAWLLLQGETLQLSPSSLRILWQLVQGATVAAAACIGGQLLFGKRAGIVVIHLGVGLLMFNEFFVSWNSVEGRMQIAAGETVNFVSDIRTLELAIVDTAEPEFVTVIPKEVLLKRNQSGDYQRVEHADIPFDVQVQQYLKNSDIVEASTVPDNPATTGHGMQAVAVEQRAASGTSGSEVDLSSFYLTIFPKGSQEALGTYLFSQAQRANRETMRWESYDRETITLPEESGTEQSLQLSLRFKRDYKPYSVYLSDVSKTDYMGTDTPRDYSSQVTLVDPSRDVSLERRIWMNNPLRYAGETFYQSGYQEQPGGLKITDLQVVSNLGWMIPYVACMYVWVGLLYHFSLTLTRFLRRRESEVDVATAVTPVSNREKKRLARRTQHATSKRSLWPVWAIPAVVALIVTLYVFKSASPTPVVYHDMDLDAFGTLPTMYQGRIKPLDTLARNGLLLISGRQTFTDNDGNDRQPAVRWLADMASGRVDDDGELIADAHPVIRIENLDVLQLLELEPRKRFRYAMSEFRERLGDLEDAVVKARGKDASDLTTYERKVIELDNRIRAYMRLQYAFRPIPFPNIPSREEFEQDREAATLVLQEVKRLIDRVPEFNRQLASMKPPLTVPGLEPDADWLPYSSAYNLAYVGQIYQEDPNPATVAWNQIFHAYGRENADEFNSAVAEYQTWLQDESDTASELTGVDTRFEAFFNGFQPFLHACVLYLAAFAIGAIGWLGWQTSFRNTASAIIFITFLLHTFALIGRIYISGRPPVTNLYSSAIFVGWGCVLAGMILERLFGLGIGNVISSVAGFSTLQIAYVFAADGDTFTVLQAVLDTQFWLSTHVTCITFGYATTFVAGLLGIVFLLGQLIPGGLSKDLQDSITRMTYGVLCFSIFFTFIGTVLGGLWADDSWGRFWGWDPKENGALLIVLWNALILHARWGKLVGSTGMAALCVAGNAVVSWSWFGTNELGIGLHAYGFREGMVRGLWIFWATQAAVIVLGIFVAMRRPRRTA